jgi:hypothetical protein
MVEALASEDPAWCPTLATIMLSLRNGPRLAAFDDPTSRAIHLFSATAIAMTSGWSGSAQCYGPRSSVAAWSAGTTAAFR